MSPRAIQIPELTPYVSLGKGEWGDELGELREKFLHVDQLSSQAVGCRLVLSD